MNNYIDGIESDTANVDSGTFLGMENFDSTLMLGQFQSGILDTAFSIAGFKVFNIVKSSNFIFQAYSAGRPTE